MLPVDRIAVVPSQGAWRPDWVGPEDYPWVVALLDELRRCDGQPVHAWRSRAAEPLRAVAPPRKQAMVASVLGDLCGERAPGPASQALREEVFRAAQLQRDAGVFNRGSVLESVGAERSVPAGAIEDALYADLPDERPLILPSPFPEPAYLARRTNLALIQSLLRRSTAVSVVITGHARAVVRQVTLRRLLCTVRPVGPGVDIDISGPFSLFRGTTMYGRSLASIVPVLRAADQFTIEASCRLGSAERTVRVASGDPIFPEGAPPTRFDSRLEERFARDFARAAPDWDVIREPEPVRVDDAWIFPDFALVHRRDPTRRWLLEIVGFWTPGYLERKLDRMRRVGRDDLIVCVDESLGVSRDALPAGLAVLPFRKRIDPKGVVEIIERPQQVEQIADAGGTTAIIGLWDLFVDFAGRRPPEDPIHARLRALTPGGELRLGVRPGRIVLVDQEDVVLAVLSTAASERILPRLESVRSARVVGVVERSASQSGAAYRERLRVERWLAPIVELRMAGSMP